MVKFKKIKITILILIALFSVACLISVKFKNFGRNFLNVGRYYHGDLFEMSRLWRFEDNITINWEDYKNKTTINNADIITMGDSFFEANYETPTVGYQLQSLTGKNVYNVNRADFQNSGDDPLAYLDKIGYKKGKAKYLVLEVVERYALETSTRYQYLTYNDYVKYVNNGGSENTGEKKAYTAGVKNFIEPSNLQYFFYNNKITEPIYEIGKNFRFEALGEIDKRTPVYSENPSMLFYYEDVDFVNKTIDKKYTDMMAYNIHLLQKNLKEKYNLDLIYVIMPTKYSIYGKYQKDYKGYNNFIPQVYDALNKLKVPSFNTYNLYVNAKDIDKDLLYYKADTHFTPRGKQMVVDEILKLLKNMGVS